ncbi:MAG: ATP-binding protein [Candidatus Krumholzibacteria bacterium]|nr:ATP-binding protein [Candidatus Krumholzibacteria bacterium]
MAFRTRLLVTFLLAVLLPMIVLALFIRDEMTDRLTAQYERRVESLLTVIEDDLSEESAVIAGSLAGLRRAVANDNRFREAAVDRDPERRRYLLDYAANAMQLTGLSMLQIQDDAGRIISSGHFRNEYDRLEPELPRLLLSLPERAALTRARAPDASFLALARADSVHMGGRRFTIIAGVTVERHFLARLAREAQLTITLIYPGGTLTSAGDGSDTADQLRQSGVNLPRDLDATAAIERELNVPFIDLQRGEVSSASFRVNHHLTELEALRRSIDRWFVVAVGASGVLVVVLVGWLASRISRPLVELADKTSRIDLDRLDIDFDTRRKDEIGVLSRLLGAMTERLRTSALLIKDAERRATLGELARQVNHDIKNGLTPIRNVFRHLIQLAGNDPTQLSDVLQERQSTLDSSISYLENLASNYARLSPRSERRPCDVNEIVRQVVMDVQGLGQVRFHTNLCEGSVVVGDPIALRRIIENLFDNAIDSLDSRPGSVTITTGRVAEGADRPQVRMTVADTGSGMTKDQVAKVFDDFYTTKENGTGLGLSIVRRLVMDLDGSIRVESEPGQGSRFVIDLPSGASA